MTKNDLVGQGDIVVHKHTDFSPWELRIDWIKTPQEKGIKLYWFNADTKKREVVLKYEG